MYLEPCQTDMMGLFARIVNGFPPINNHHKNALTIFLKRSMIRSTFNAQFSSSNIRQLFKLSALYELPTKCEIALWIKFCIYPAGQNEQGLVWVGSMKWLSNMNGDEHNIKNQVEKKIKGERGGLRNNKCWLMQGNLK